VSSSVSYGYLLTTCLITVWDWSSMKLLKSSTLKKAFFELTTLYTTIADTLIGLPTESMIFTFLRSRVFNFVEIWLIWSWFGKHQWRPGSVIVFLYSPKRWTITSSFSFTLLIIIINYKLYIYIYIFFLVNIFIINIIFFYKWIFFLSKNIRNTTRTES